MSNPIKYTLKSEWPSLAMILGIIIFSAIVYPGLSDKIASHWNFAGQVDGWSNKNFMICFFPGLIIFMYALMSIMPNIDPKKDSYTGFATTYNNFKNLLVGVLSLIYVITILVNLGYNINISKIISLIIGTMLIVIGFMLKNIKSNWFIGIRTPWTMSSTVVWEKTHQASVYFFGFLGLSLIATPYLPNPWNIIIFTLGILQMIGGTIIYSYFIYKKELKK